MQKHSIKGQNIYLQKCRVSMGGCICHTQCKFCSLRCVNSPLYISEKVFMYIFFVCVHNLEPPRLCARLQINRKPNQPTDAEFRGESNEIHETEIISNRFFFLDRVLSDSDRLSGTFKEHQDLSRSRADLSRTIQ